VLVVLGLILLNSCDNKKSLPDCDGTNYPNCYCVRGFTGNAAQKWNKKQDCLKKGGIDDNKKPLTKFEASQYCAIKSGEFAKEVRKEVYKECMNDEGF
jgi:hypothetical protein